MSHTILNLMKHMLLFKIKELQYVKQLSYDERQLINLLYVILFET